MRREVVRIHYGIHRLLTSFAIDGGSLADAAARACARLDDMHALDALWKARLDLWSTDPAVWRRRACAIAGRNLTREEWKLYLPAGTPYAATCTEWPTG